MYKACATLIVLVLVGCKTGGVNPTLRHFHGKKFPVHWSALTWIPVAASDQIKAFWIGKN
jgi:hypothetical protein